MRRPRTSPAGLITPVPLVMAVLLVVATSLALTASPAAATPSYSLDERAAAIDTPALVFLEFRLEGVMRTRSSGEAVDPTPVSVPGRCSGIAVSPDGYVVTTTHCWSPDILRQAAAPLVADNLIKEGKLASGQKSSYVTQLLQTADFTNTTARGTPAVTVTAQLYTPITGTADTKTIPATMVDSQSPADGETTLVKLDQPGLPSALLADVPLATNLHGVILGYFPSDLTQPKVTYTARNRSVSIIGTYGNGTPPRYLLDNNLGAYSHGGMVVDTDGQVVGMITADLTSKDGTNKIVTPTATILKLLADNRIKNSLGPMDQAYRDGLNAYFGGHYSDAIKKLDTVLAASPDNPLAKNYRQQAAIRLSIEGDDQTASRVPTILAAVEGVLILALIAVLAFMVVRGRRRERDFMYFDPYTSPQPSSSGPVSAAPVSYPTSAPPTIAPTQTVPISAVPASASPYAPQQVSGPPGGYYYPPPAPQPDLAPPPAPTYPVVVPVPPPTPMSVAPQYGQALPEPWAPPVGPVPVPVPQQPAAPPTGTLYPQQPPQPLPQAVPQPLPQAPTTAPPAGPPVGAEPPTGQQPWDVPDEERMYGSPPDAYRHRP